MAGTAFNPVDVAIRAGFMQQVFPVAFPHIPNFDVAGVIAEVGEGVSGWSAGDAVVAFLPMTAPGRGRRVRRRAGRCAGRRSPHRRARRRRGAALVRADGLAVAVRARRPKAGQSILVNGAGGAVGGYAVQLAKQAGAAVTATGSARSADRIRSYGADRIIDYTATPLLQAVAGQRFDVVLNLVRTSPEETARLADLVADGGTFVSTTTPGPDDARRGVRTVQVFARSDAAQLARARRPRRRRRPDDRRRPAAAADRPARRPRRGRRRAAARQDHPDPLNPRTDET